MNILKVLHQKGILKSVRGASGGYQIAADLSAVSLLDLSNLVDRIEPEQEFFGKNWRCTVRRRRCSIGLSASCVMSAWRTWFFPAGGLMCLSSESV